MRLTQIFKNMPLTHISKKGSKHRKTYSILRKKFNVLHFFGINFVELFENMFIKIATFISHNNLNVQFLRLNKTYPKSNLLSNPNQESQPLGPPYGTFSYLTRTQGVSPLDPRYGILAYLTLTQGASSRNSRMVP